MGEYKSVSDQKAESMFGGQLGIRSKIEGTSLLYFISGVDLSYKNMKIKGGGVDPTNLQFLSFEVPVFVGFNLMKNLGAYVGPKFSVTMNVFCQGLGDCSVINEHTKEITYPLQVGVQYQISEKFGVDLYYEHGLAPLVKSTLPFKEETYMHLVGVNLTYNL